MRKVIDTDRRHKGEVHRMKKKEQLTLIFKHFHKQLTSIAWRKERLPVCF